MTPAAEQFRNAIRAAGLNPPDVIEADGKLRRFPSNGKRHDDSGWYVLHGDGIPAGAFGDWRTGLSETWRTDIGRRLSPQEEAAHRARVETMRREREVDDAKRKAEAREKAAAIWHGAGAAPEDHTYLVKKAIKAHGVRVHEGALVIPMRDGGELHSLQFIGPDGDKRFLTGGRVSGCYFPIGKPDGALCIAEGYATGASIHEATGFAVAVALNAGNLLPVARTLREKFPDMRLIVCVDDDHKTPGNPGMTKATEAARAVGGLLAMPDFGADRPEGATDFNDLHRARGAEAVKRAIANAAIPCVLAEGGSAAALDYEGVAGTVTLIRGSDMEPEPITWLWDGYLATGKLHIIAGAPGAGKTTIALAFAATVTTGGRWPDGTRADPGNALIWSGEDDPRDTLLPRLLVMGADVGKVYFVGDAIADGKPRSFDPARDMVALEREAERIGNVRLVIVDPIVNAVAGDSHKNTETRRALQPVVDLARRLKAAALGVSHFSKNTSGRDPVERVTGSIAFGAMPRIIFGAAKSTGEDGHTQRLLVRAKSNIGPDGGGFEYQLHQGELPHHPGMTASRVEWGKPLEGEARDLLATVEAVTDQDERSAVEDAAGFLRELLGDGPVPSKQVRADAEGAGHSWAAIRRAQKGLGVDVVKAGLRGGWEWHLPSKVLKTPEDAQQNKVSIFGKLEHLREGAASHDVNAEIL